MHVESAIMVWQISQYFNMMWRVHSGPAHGGSGPPKLFLMNLLPTSPSLAGHNGSKHSWPQWVHGTFRCSYLTTVFQFGLLLSVYMESSNSGDYCFKLGIECLQPTMASYLLIWIYDFTNTFIFPMWHLLNYIWLHTFSFILIIIFILLIYF
jgi:hypothetical protein